MTTILIVDDEPAQSRGLSRAISLRRPEYTVLTSGDGEEAVSVLESCPIDLVLTDLQMNTMSGFDLLAWLVRNKPSVLAFAMTAYGSDETCARLSELGFVESFAKPLDIDALLARVAEDLAQSMHGHVENVGLASFLQLIEIERKTCTLHVRSAEHSGRLFLRKGELLDAHTGEQTGEEAALAIIGWVNASIAIDSGCRVAARRIWKPVHHVIMESMRVRDEANDSLAVGGSMFPSRAESTGLFDVPVLLSSSEQTGLLSRPPRKERESVRLPPGVLALLVVELSTGNLQHSELRIELAANDLARGAHALLQQQLDTIARATDGEMLDELVLTAPSLGEIIRPWPGRDAFAMLLFDPFETNLVMARLELDAFMRS